jgi:hypothetical protein
MCLGILDSIGQCDRSSFPCRGSEFGGVFVETSPMQHMSKGILHRYLCNEIHNNCAASGFNIYGNRSI